jgi:NAD(P)H-hydrate epimerase
MSERTKDIENLLLQTGKAHHEAYLEVDGEDPDWPLWYAEYLKDLLPPIIGKDYTVSELTYLFIDFDRRHRATTPESPWHAFYAQNLLAVDQEYKSEIPWANIEVPALTTSQMIEVDRAMIEDYQINLTQMMENAGRNLAHLARIRFLDNTPQGKRIIVLAGTGGNGGGALVAARRLANYGAKVKVATTRPVDAFQGIPAHQLQILQNMGVQIITGETLEIDDGSLHLILDGIIGYSLSGSPRGSAANLIRWANNQNVPILSLDMPSGIDGTIGLAYDPSIEAAATMTLALPKRGLMENELVPSVGELYLADISVPPALFAGPKLNLEVGPIFASNDIIRLR